MDLRRYDYPSAKVSIELRDDRNFEESVIAQYGDAEHPITQDQLETKFLTFATEVIGRDRAKSVLEMVKCLEIVTDITELTRLLIVS